MARKGTGPKKGRSICPGLKDDIKVLNMNVTFQVPANTSMKQLIAMMDSLGYRPSDVQFWGDPDAVRRHP